MNRLKLLLGAVFLIGLSTIGFGSLASAHSFHSGNEVVINSAKVNDSVLATGSNVDISSEVFGDVFCAGQTITISGTVHGDILCAGQTVNISGVVDGDVRLAGQTVNISGVVDGNVTIAGQYFSLATSGEINGDTTFAGASAIINGSVGRDLAVGGESTVINNKIGRNVRANVETLKLLNSAQIDGNIDLTSNNELVKLSGATVGGEVTRNSPPVAQQQEVVGVAGIAGAAVAIFAYWFFTILISAIVLALLLPKMFHQVTSHAIPSPWKALLVGLVTSLILPIILVILGVTIIGLPLVLLLVLAWLVVVMLSVPVSGYYVGRLILPRSQKPLLIMLLGMLVLLMLCAIPVIGLLIALVGFWVGVGSLVLEIIHRTPRPSYRLADMSPIVTKKKV